MAAFHAFCDSQACVADSFTQSGADSASIAQICILFWLPCTLSILGEYVVCQAVHCSVCAHAAFCSVTYATPSSQLGTETYYPDVATFRC